MPDRNAKPAAFIRLSSDIRSLNSGLLIISQKIKYLVRNEKILGRNLIVLNRKIQSLEERLSSGAIGGAGSADVQVLIEKIEETNRKIADLDVRLNELRNSVVTEERFNELKYVIDSINPLEFATIGQVKDMIAERGKKPRA